MKETKKIERWEMLVAELQEKFPDINFGRLCPATLHLSNGFQCVCYDCGEGWCAKFAELGLDETAAPLRKSCVQNSVRKRDPVSRAKPMSCPAKNVVACMVA